MYQMFLTLNLKHDSLLWVPFSEYISLVLNGPVRRALTKQCQEAGDVQFRSHHVNTYSTAYLYH